MRNVLVICILTALVEEPTKMIIVEQRASTEAAASMQKSLSGSSIRMEAASMQAGSYSSSSRSAATAEYSFQSMSASSMSAMMAESMVSMSSSSQMMEMSAHSHAKASSSQRALTAGLKTGEMHFKRCLKLALQSEI